MFNNIFTGFQLANISVKHRIGNGVFELSINLGKRTETKKSTRAHVMSAPQ